MTNKIENRLRSICLRRLGTNLAAVLVFGSYRTGQFVMGKSDIDLMILLKKFKGIKPQAERDILFHIEFPKLPVKVRLSNFSSIPEYKDHIYTEGSWTSWITILKGSTPIYDTPGFIAFQRDLREHPIPRKDVIEYLLHKDKIELDGYFTRSSGWDLTKSMFSHMRRKLQILNYYSGNEIEFDYDICLDNLSLKERDMLERLGDLYNGRKHISSDREYKKYYSLAKNLTKKIKEVLK